MNDNTESIINILIYAAFYLPIFAALSYMLLSYVSNMLWMTSYKKRLKNIDLNQYSVFGYYKNGMPRSFQNKKNANEILYI